MAQERAHGGQDRPARHPAQVGEDEVEMARALAAWGVDQAQPARGEQEADRDPGLAQQPLEARRRRGVPAVGRVLPRPVESCVLRFALHEQEPAGLLALAARHGEVRPQRDFELAQRAVEFGGCGDEPLRRPIQELAEDPDRLADLARAVEQLLEPIAPRIDLGRAGFERHLPIGEDGGGEDEPHGLDVTQPLAVLLDQGIAVAAHGAAGQR